jgi:hypothetical protein
MSKVLVDINVLGSFPSADDVAPLDVRGIILVHWCGSPLSEAKSFQKRADELRRAQKSSESALA